MTNGASTFQQLMSVVFHAFGNFAMAYVDDMIIFNPTLKVHTKYIQKVFDHLRQHDLKLKLPKCKLIQDHTQYLGFIMSKDGIMANPEKVK